ncbi:MAG: hypothetical protein AAF253_10830 [Pseudomonadota bacterium]
MMITCMRAAYLAGLLALFSPIASAIGIGLQPTTVEVSLQPGERQRQSINIVNVHQELTISLTIGLADWDLDEDGQIVLAAPGDMERSGADWARFSPGFVTLEPGESEQIIVDMSVPARVDGPGDYRFALLASTILPEERNAGAGVWRRYQLATLFYVTTGDAESHPEVVSSGVSVDDAGAAVVALRLENEGNAHARLNGAVEVIVGDETTEYAIGNVVVLDKGARNLQVPLTEALPADAGIRVVLENSFEPQSNIGVRSLDPVHVAWTASDLESQKGIQKAEADGAQDDPVDFADTDQPAAPEDSPPVDADGAAERSLP